MKVRLFGLLLSLMASGCATRSVDEGESAYFSFLHNQHPEYFSPALFVSEKAPEFGHFAGFFCAGVIMPPPLPELLLNE